MAKSATIYDYVKLQGGRPSVLQDDDGLWHIKHQYRDDSPEIVTHVSPSERGIVVLEDGKAYEVAYLWQFEGEPCETESIKNGGYGYDRKL